VNGTPQIATPVHFVNLPQSPVVPLNFPTIGNCTRLPLSTFLTSLIDFIPLVADNSLLVPNIYGAAGPLTLSPNYNALTLNASPTANSTPSNPFPLNNDTSPTNSSEGSKRKRKRSSVSPNPNSRNLAQAVAGSAPAPAPTGGVDLLAPAAGQPRPANASHARLMILGLPPKSRVETQMKMNLKLTAHSNSSQPLQHYKHIILDDHLVAPNQSRRRSTRNSKFEKFLT